MAFDFRHLLRVLGGARSLAGGKLAHGKLIVSGILPDVVMNNRIVSLYDMFDRVDDARKLFDCMPQKNVVSWTIMASAYCKSGDVNEAIDLVRSMVLAGVDPNGYTYVALLSTCAGAGLSWIGKEVHGRIYRVEQSAASGFVGNSLINSYAKCGLMILARRVFDSFTRPSLVSWGSILSGYVQCGENEEAFRVLSRARKEGMEVNEYIITNILNACSNLSNSMIGKQLHCLAIKSGNGSDRFVEAGIVDMYVKSHQMDLAFRAFSELEEPGLASWAVLIGGFVNQGEGMKALVLLREMLSFRLLPNEYIFPPAFVACSTLGTVQGGMQFHCLIVKLGFRMSAHVGNSVMDFYAKCGLLNDSSKIFERMEETDIVSWNSMIDSHVKQRNLKGVRSCLKTMLLEHVCPDEYTYSSILSLCADLPGTKWGPEAHSQVLKHALAGHVVVGSVLVDMYAKCGNLKYADGVFSRMTLKNLVSWNSIISGYAQHGHGQEALDIFRRMEVENIMPNDITYVGVLTACAHVGLVEQGQWHFQNMKDYGITARMDHYACMVDLFARAGLLEMAFEFIRTMPLEPNKVIWRSLLSGCKIHGNIEIGVHAAKCILQIDPEDFAAHVMLSGVCADIGMWDAKAELRETVNAESRKVPGCSWI